MTLETITQNLLVLFIFGLSLTIIILTTLWFFKRSATILERWAEQNRYELLESKINWFNQGPFFWTSSKGQTVYYVQVLDRRNGQTRRGWVRCGSFWGGLMSDKAEVRWDEREL
jgi:hypothetical protein